MTAGASIEALNTDLKVGLAFLTRLPFVGTPSASGADVARATSARNAHFLAVLSTKCMTKLA